LSPLIEICVVVATLAVVAIAVAVVRTLHRIEKTTDQVSKLTGEIHQWVGQAGEIMVPMRRVADRFQILGERAAALSEAVLREVEGPVHTTAVVARGVRSVTSYFLDRLSHRLTRGHSAKHRPTPRNRTEGFGDTR